MKTGTGSAWLKLRFVVLRRDEFTCQYCGRGVADGAVLHLDHIYPKSKGGEWAEDNLITACLECNLGKRDVVLSKRETDKLCSGIE
jgi:5-methylcytosine-specific restriction endonuclease McrA